MIRFFIANFIGTVVAFQAFAQHNYNQSYAGQNLSRVAFPIGGIGSGMLTLEGTGAISHMSIRHHPDMFNEPVMFAALFIKGKGAKVLEGPVPDWKKFGQRDDARGGEGTDHGLARFRSVRFAAKFPFGKVELADRDMPAKVTLTGWSPFIPTNADNSSLPVGALEYTITNSSDQTQNGVFSYNAENFVANHYYVAKNSISSITNGFVLEQDTTIKNPEDKGSFAIFTDEPNTTTDLCWFRGGWWDPLTMAWKKINSGDTKAVAAVAKDAPGASLYVPFSLKPKERKTIKVYFCWYVPYSSVRTGGKSDNSSDTTLVPTNKDQPSPYYMPWYAKRFKDIGEVIAYWKDNYTSLKANTQKFTNAFYNSTLPPEVLEAVAANLTILKSPTVMRQYDGRFWGWEGSNDHSGSCYGSCTHVYDYAQSMCHLFPSLECSMRETEYGEGLNSFGNQCFREALPIRPQAHGEPAADGQLGCIIRVYRDWRISGDDNWISKLYPKVKLSLDYCIKTFDPDHTGTTIEPHANTYDIVFWGADGMCTSIYLSALEAVVQMGSYLHENTDEYQTLLAKGKLAMETKLYNGKYFFQKVQWKGLHQPIDTGSYYYKAPEARVLLNKEGPNYQYGNGVLSDGVIGSWLARVCDLPDPVDENRVKSHLEAVYQYNFKTDLSNYSNPQRPTFALGNEGGLLLCSWPSHDQPSLPFVYSNEVWTGIEYEVASHLIFEGKVQEGLNIVRTTRKRYDGRVRNPFDEYECGHWYARAMSSYALLQALTGVTYDAVTKTLTVDSRVGDFTTFLSTNTGFGNVIYKNGKVALKVVYGKIDVQHIQVKKG